MILISGPNNQPRIVGFVVVQHQCHSHTAESDTQNLPVCRFCARAAVGSTKTLMQICLICAVQLFHSDVFSSDESRLLQVIALGLAFCMDAGVKSWENSLSQRSRRNIKFSCGAAAGSRRANSSQANSNNSSVSTAGFSLNEIKYYNSFKDVKPTSRKTPKISSS